MIELTNILYRIFAFIIKKEKLSDWRLRNRIAPSNEYSFKTKHFEIRIIELGSSFRTFFVPKL